MRFLKKLLQKKLYQMAGVNNRPTPRRARIVWPTSGYVNNKQPLMLTDRKIFKLKESQILHGFQASPVADEAQNLRIIIYRLFGQALWPARLPSNQAFTASSAAAVSAATSASNSLSGLFALSLKSCSISSASIFASIRLRRRSS